MRIFHLFFAVTQLSLRYVAVKTRWPPALSLLRSQPTHPSPFLHRISQLSLSSSCYEGSHCSFVTSSPLRFAESIIMNLSMSTASPIVTTATQRNGSTSVISSSTQFGSSSPIRQRIHAGLIRRSSLLQQQTVASSLPAMTTALGNVLVPSTLAGVQHPSSSAFTGISAATGTEQLPASFAALHQPSTTHVVNSVGERQHPASFVIASHPSNGAGVDVPAFSAFPHPSQHAGYDPAYPSAALHVPATRCASHPLQHAGYDPAYHPAAHLAFNVLPSSAVSQQHIPSDPLRLHHSLEHAGYDPAHHSAAHSVSDLRISSRPTQYAGYDPAYPPAEHHSFNTWFTSYPMQLAGYDPADPSAAHLVSTVPASSVVPQHTPAALLRPHFAQHTGYDPGNLAAVHEQHLPSALYSPHFKQQPGHDSLSAAGQTEILPDTSAASRHQRGSSVSSSPQWIQQTGCDPGASAASVLGYDSRYGPTSSVTHPHRVTMASSSPHRLKLAGYIPSSYAVNQNGVLPPSSSAVSRRQWALRQAQQAGFTPAFSSAAPVDVRERYVPPAAVHQQSHGPAIFHPHSAMKVGHDPGYSSTTLQARYDPVVSADQHHITSVHRDFQFVQVAPAHLPSAALHQPFLPASNSPPSMDKFSSRDPSVAFHHSGYDPPVQPTLGPYRSHRFIVEHASTSTTKGSAPAFIATGPQVSAHAAGFTPAPDLYSDSRRLPAVPNLLIGSAYADSLQRPIVNITANGAGMIPALSSMLRTLSFKSEQEPRHELNSTVTPDQGSTLAPATTRSHLTSTVYCVSGAPICSSIADSLQSSSASGALHSDVNYGSEQHLPTAASSHFEPFSAAAARISQRSSSAKASSSFGFIQQQPHTPNPSTIHRQTGFTPVSIATDPSAQTCDSPQLQSVLPSFSSTDS